MVEMTRVLHQDIKKIFERACKEPGVNDALALLQLSQKSIEEDAFNRGHQAGYDAGYKAGYDDGVDVMGSVMWPE